MQGACVGGADSEARGIGGALLHQPGRAASRGGAPAAECAALTQSQGRGGLLLAAQLLHQSGPAVLHPDSDSQPPASAHRHGHRRRRGGSAAAAGGGLGRQVGRAPG
jgi:hypothetical protein